MQRLFDVLLSIIALITLAPVFGLIMVILRFTGEGEIFFRQIRIGMHHQPFHLLKFASMLKDSPNIGAGTITLKDDPRVLPFGRFLRATKLNELPQLINVLRGEMSIIGPRPQTPRCFYAFPTLVQQAIVTVRPGASGIGSIVFRNEENMIGGSEDRLDFYDQVIAPYKGALEQWYIDHFSLKLYFIMIFLTGFAILFPNNKIIWKLFPDLPKPPDELSSYFNI